MPTLPTFDELYETGKAEIQARNADLTDFNPGSNLDAVNGGAAMIGEEVLRGIVALFGAQFIDLASGSDLDFLALDRFRLTRKAASKAVGELRFTRGSSTGTVAIPSGTQASASVDGVTINFVTTAAGSLPVGESTVDVAAEAVVSGREGNVAVATVTSLDSAIPGDADMTVSNPERFTGGDAAETDARFRERIREYFQNLRRGTVSALTAGAKQVAGVVYAAVDESTAPLAAGGYVSVYIGDPDARANTALVTAVDTALEDWRCAGINVTTFAADREEVVLALSVTIKKGADRAGIRKAAADAVRAELDTFGPGQPVYLGRLTKAAIGVSPDAFDAKVTSHTADIEPTTGNLAVRVADDGLTVSIIELSS